VIQKIEATELLENSALVVRLSVMKSDSKSSSATKSAFTTFGKFRFGCQIVSDEI